jgi:biopolymer transport protein ExbB
VKLYQYLIVILLLSGYLSPAVAADEAMSLDTLLKQVQQGRIDESKENKAREDAFRRDKASQAGLVKKPTRKGLPLKRSVNVWKRNLRPTRTTSMY